MAEKGHGLGIDTKNLLAVTLQTQNQNFSAN